MFARKKKRIWHIVPVVVSAMLVLLGVGTYLFARSLSLELRLKGESLVTQEYGGTYVDAGGEVVLKSLCFGDKIIDVPITVRQAVDPHKVGIYGIIYHGEYLWLNDTAQRLVSIVDTTAPVITLVENPDSYTLPGAEYVEDGFSAWDDYDGDITEQVTWSLAGNIMTYTVSDSSGNTAIAQRTICFDDRTPPELMLKGECNIVIHLGREYIEPGFSAVDNLDGDITADVHISGTVDIHTLGIYTIQYSVTDAHGNTAQQTRTVSVEPVPQPEITVPEGTVVYLTFDDGPSQHTPRLLEILRKYGVKATFFVVNTGNIDVIRDIAADGHAIGVHSATHSYGDIYASEDAFFRDFETMYNIIYEKTGVKTTLLRFPGGSSNTVSRSYNMGVMTRLAQRVTDYGLQYFDWNVNSMDAGGARSADEIFFYVTRGIANNRCSVVLQHDIYGFSVDAVERIIQWGLEKGCTFLPLEPNSPSCHHTIVN